MHCLILIITSLLPGFLFTDMHDLYLHHRNIYDRIIRQKIANLPLDLGSSVILVLIASLPLRTSPLTWNFIDYFPPAKGHTQDNYSALYFKPPARICYRVGYNPLLDEFLTDPIRAGKYVLDGSKYALVARFLLDCFIHPCPKQAFLEQVVSWHKLSLEY
jgi:hypothetical protein